MLLYGALHKILFQADREMLGRSTVEHPIMWRVSMEFRSRAANDAERDLVLGEADPLIQSDPVYGSDILDK